MGKILKNHAIVSQEAMNNELASLIKQIVDVVSNEDMRIEITLVGRKKMINTLENMAAQAELKIRSKQVNDIRRKILDILKASTNRLIIATVEYWEN